MKRKNNNFIVATSIGVIAFSLVCLASLNSNKNNSMDLRAEDFISDNSFIMFADLPPNPFSQESLTNYKDLGMNVVLLTEDYTPMVDSNGNLAQGYKNAINEIGNAGLNCWIRNMYNDADYFDNDNPSKERRNYSKTSEYSLSIRHLTDEFKKLSAVTGFYMADEPFMFTDTPIEKGYLEEIDPFRYAAMDQYDKLVNWFNEYYGEGYSWHMNHVPSSSYDHWPSEETYKSFLEYYMDNIIDKITNSDTKTLSIDNYPFKKNRSDIDSSYLSDLLTGAIVTRNYNKDKTSTEKANFGLAIQSFYDGNIYRAPKSSKEISYQMYTGMSLGAKTYEFFTYNSMSDIVGMIDTNQNQTDQYTYVKDAISRAKPLAKAVLNFDWQNLIVSPASDANNRENSDSFNKVTSVVNNSNKGRLVNYSSTYDASIGYLTNGDSDGYFVVNQSLNNDNTVSMSFSDAEKVLIFHEDEYHWQNLSNGELTLNVNEGDGYFVIAPTSDEETIFVKSGNHYARKAPNENESGVKEYYVSCDDHSHYALEDGKMYFRGVHYSNSSCIQLIIANYTDTFNNGGNFLATDSGFNIDQSGSTERQAGWFSQGFVDGKYRVLTPTFAVAAVDNQVWMIKANSLLTDSSGKQYRVDKDYKFVYNASLGAWKMRTASLIPNGNWGYNENLVATSVDIEDDRYIAPIVPTFDISSTPVGYNTNSVIQINCDLNLGDGIYANGDSFDISEVRVYKNNELTNLYSVQYFHTEGGTSLLSLNLGNASGEVKGDVLHLVAGSIFKITINDIAYLRILEKDTYFQYNGSIWQSFIGSKLNILPTSSNVQYNMVYINCGNVFGISSNTNATFYGEVKLNDVILDSFSVTAAGGGGFFFSNIGSINGTSFTFSIKKYSSIRVNNIGLILLADYSVSFDGTSFSWN